MQDHTELKVEIEREPSDKNCTNILNCHFTHLLFKPICRDVSAYYLAPTANLVMLHSDKVSLLHWVVSLRLHKLIFFPHSYLKTTILVNNVVHFVLI